MVGCFYQALGSAREEEAQRLFLTWPTTAMFVAVGERQRMHIGT
jgi:hypothetical protein